MALVAKLYLENGGDALGNQVARRAERRRIQADVTLRDDSSLPIDAEILDLSTSGCLVVANCDLPVPSIVTIALAGTGRIPARVMRRDGDRFGCAFVLPLSEAEVSAARAVETVVTLAALGLPSPASIPDVQRLPVRTRMLVIVGSALAAWGLLIAGIMIVWALG